MVTGPLKMFAVDVEVDISLTVCEMCTLLALSHVRIDSSHCFVFTNTL